MCSATVDGGAGGLTEEKEGKEKGGAEKEEEEKEEEKGSEAIRGCFGLTVVRNLISSSRFNIGENINKRPNVG